MIGYSRSLCFLLRAEIPANQINGQNSFNCDNWIFFHRIFENGYLSAIWVEEFFPCPVLYKPSSSPSQLMSSCFPISVSSTPSPNFNEDAHSIFPIFVYSIPRPCIRFAFLKLNLADTSPHLNYQSSLISSLLLILRRLSIRRIRRCPSIFPPFLGFWLVNQWVVGLDPNFAGSIYILLKSRGCSSHFCFWALIFWINVDVNFAWFLL